jgi:hypothetical protein
MYKQTSDSYGLVILAGEEAKAVVFFTLFWFFGAFQWKPINWPSCRVICIRFEKKKKKRVNEEI